MFFRRFTLYLPLLFTLGTAAGQVTVGSISGYVLDPNRRPIPNAMVRAVDPARAAQREARCDEAGYYKIADLGPAEYAVTASAERFEPGSQSLSVAVNSVNRLDFRLSLPGARESVTVHATIPPVQSETSDLGMVLEQTRLDLLPLNRRDFLQLALLTPGVAPPVEASELSSRGGFAMHANGAREEYNDYLLDGVDNNDSNTNRYVLQPPVDAIQEFKISTNSYTAEYGRNAGAQVNVITRSGSNTMHGFAYEYLRNRALDARNFFEGSERAKYIRNQFGAGVGGPLVRQRTFFFANIDALREREGQTRLGSVPTLAMRNGNLSAFPDPVINPFTQAPFAGNIVPTPMISPYASKYFDLFPKPNLSGISGNYLSSPVQTDSQTQTNLRLDHRLSARDQLALRYSYGVNSLFEPFTETSTDLPGFGDRLKDRGHNGMVNYVHTFGSEAANALTLGFNRGLRQLLAENSNVNVNALWGVSYLPKSQQDWGYPGVSVAGFSHVGDVAGLPIDRAATTYQVSDGFSWVTGAHGFKAGGEVRYYHNNSILDLLARGTLNFAGAITGNGVGDLLLGIPTLGIQAKPENPQAQRTHSMSLYFQDDWKVSRSLTANLGVRYDFFAPVTDAADRMSVFDLKSMSLIRVGTKGVSRSGFASDKNNFAPRVGLAWSPNPTLAVRAGYGIYYDGGMTVVNSSPYFNPPYFTLRVYFPTATSMLSLSNPFPTGGGFAPAASLTTLSPTLSNAYLQHWSFSVQKQMEGIGVATLAYAGSRGSHLIRSRDINQPTPGPGDVADRAPYPDFSNIMLVESAGKSSYHSLQASLNRPLARNLSLIVAYTFSKSIDDTSAFLATRSDPNFPQNSRNFSAERALSSFDTPHRLTLAYVYQSPWSSPWLRHWQANGIIVAQSGQPFTPVLTEDNSNTGNTGGSFGSDRPNLIRNPVLANPTPEKWFDTSAFAMPSAYTFGNAGRNILRGDGLFTVDTAISRTFPFGETTALSVEAQAFNLLNGVNFSMPQHNFGQDDFGKVFSARAPRQIQFAVRLKF